jgi:integrase
MAIEERSGRYRGVYRLPGDRKKYFTPTFDSYWEAAAAVEEAKGVEAPPAARPVDTVADQAHDWLSRRNVAPATLSFYRTMVTCGVDDYPLGGTLLATLDHRDIERWIVDQIRNGTGKPTLNARLKVLRMILKDAVLAKLIDSDPTANVKRMKHQPRAGRYFTDAEVDALLETAAEDQRFRLLILLCVDAGLRWEEASAMCVDAVGKDFVTVKRSTNRRGDVLDDTKNHKDRLVPITDRLAAELAKAVKPARLARGPKGLLVCNDNGRPVGYTYYLRQLLQPAFTAAGITGSGLGFHDLRHTFGSKCAERNVPMSVIQRWMGHSDPEITDRYIHAGAAATELEMMRRVSG